MKSYVKALSGVFVLVLFALAISACGGSGSSSSSSTASEEPAATEEGSASEEESGSGGEITIDVGTGTLKYPAGTKPKIAMFAGSGNAYQEALRESAEETADKYGYELTFFDNKFDPTEELKQLQTALTGGEFNAWMIESTAGKIICTTIQKGSAANIAIIQVGDFSCEQTSKPANEESWTPGTVASVGGATTITYYESFAKKVAEAIKPNAEVGLINGIATVQQTEQLKGSLEQAGIHPVDEIDTSYTTPEGLAAAQTMMQSHPGINVMVSLYSDLTIGAAKAIDQAGKTGEIEVYDLGASKQNVKLIEEGKQTASQPIFPRSAASTAIDAFHEVFEGKEVERFLPGFSLGTPEEPFWVTKETLDEYEAEF